MSTLRARQRELSQNFLADGRAIRRFVERASATHGPILEIGAGGGALTEPLAALGRPLTAVEIDPDLVRTLRARYGRRLRIVEADILRFRIPHGTGLVAGNIPFHITTAILRKLLEDPNWQESLLICQWDVARRRAGVGGASLLTAQWAPWFEFALHERVPARAFRPMPAVDGGVLAIRRLRDPGIPSRERPAFQAFVRRVYGAPGRTLQAMLRHAIPAARRRQLERWLDGRSSLRRALPRDLPAEDWISLWRAAGR